MEVQLPQPQKVIKLPKEKRDITINFPAFKFPERKKVQVDPSGLPSDTDLGFTDTLADKVKYKFLEMASLVSPGIFIVVLIISNGYFFSGFKSFNLTDLNTTVQYGAGAAVEITTAALLYSSALAKKKGRTNWRTGLIQASALLLFSVVAQYIYLKLELALNPSTVESIPIFGGLVGVGGMTSADVIYLIRSVGLHTAELFSIFLTVPRGMTIEKILEVQRKKHEYSSQKSMQDSALAFSSSIQTMVTSIMAREQAKVEQESAKLLEVHTVESVPYIQPVEEPKVLSTPVDPTPYRKYEPTPDFTSSLLDQAFPFPSNRQSLPTPNELSPLQNQRWEED